MICERQTHNFVFHINGRWGAADSTGKYITPAAYSTRDEVFELLKGKNRDDFSDNYVSYTPYSIGNFYHGRARITDQKSRDGYINGRGKLVIPCRFSAAADFIDRKARVVSEYKKVSDSMPVRMKSFINRHGKLLLPWSVMPYVYSDGLMDTVSMKGAGLVNLKGKIIVPPIYSAVEYKGHNRYVVWSDTNVGIVTRQGKKIVPVHYRALSYSKSRYGVYIGNDWYLLNRRGRQIAKLDAVAGVNDFTSGLSAVENDEGLHGYINKRGRLVIPFRYKKAYGFVHGGALVSDSATDNYGIINKHGKAIIPMQYTSMDYFNRRCPMCVYAAGFSHWAFINRHGRRITPFMFSAPDDHAINSRLIAVEVYGHHYYINRKGRIKLEVHIP